MAKEQQRIHKLNGRHKQSGRPPRRRMLLIVFLGVITSYVTAVILNVAWKIHYNNIIIDDESDGNVGRRSIGAETMMLSNFVVETGKKKKKIPILNDPASPSSIVQKLIDRSHRIEIPNQNRTLAFVHIGKSGGSTISLLLRNGCMTAVDGTKPCEANRWEKIPGQHQETIASQRIQFYLHTPHVESGKMAEYYKRVSTVVVVARDPLERFVSAFLCRHPRNIDATRTRNVIIRKEAESRGFEPPIWAKQVWGGGDVEQDQVHRAAFTGCYPNLEELVDCATQSKKEISNKVFKTRITWVKRGAHSKDIRLDCKEICKGIVSSENENIHHLRFNYVAFLKDLPPESEVFVIRTKKLWQDWIDVNKLLGAERHVDVPDKGNGDVVNARGGNLPIKNNLSNHGRSVICGFLIEDIRIYIDLLNRAVNLSDDDVRLALEGVEKNCPSVLKSLVEDKVG